MRYVIKSAKTIEEAIELGIKELGLTRDEIEFEVMQEPTKAVFGLFGGNDAMVKVKEKAKMKINLDEIFAETNLDITTEDTVEEFDFDEEIEDKFNRMQDEEFDLDKEELFVEEEVILNDEDEEDLEENTNETDDLYEDGYTPEFIEEAENSEEFAISEEFENKREEDFESYTSDQNLVNIRDLQFSGEACSITDEDDIKQAAEKAKKILEDLLIKMHIETKVSYETHNDNVINFNLEDISENDTGIIIGSKGETLNAVQYILSLLANRNTSKFLRITLNAGEYRNRRKKAIESNAQRVAYKVLKTKKSIALKPMNSYERRIVHFALQDYKEIETVSTGKFPSRKVIVKYKGFN
ncbi:MAG: RNA-binding cell elongation regulator Jag/EloR [Helcococcus sp.]|nr:RNA-binding cell elongation regulator Jag/EloR [Helcococcus sp.]